MAYGGNIKLYDYLLSIGCVSDIADSSRAAYRGQIEILKHLHSLGVPFSGMVYGIAAEGGFLNVLEYLESIQIEKHIHAMGTVTNVECFRWIMDKGYVINTSTYNSICRSENVELLSALLDTGYHRTYNGNSVCALICSTGNVECLKLARSRGCRWDHISYRNAIINNYLECVRWLFENGCPYEGVADQFITSNTYPELVGYTQYIKIISGGHYL